MREIIFSEAQTKIKAYHYAQEDPNSKIVLIIYPEHPQISDMYANTAKEVFNTFVSKGFSALRIGLDISETTPSKHTDNKNDLTMAAMALDWLHTVHPSAKSVWLAGFSSGSWLVSQLLMRRPEINRFVTISFPVTRYEFSFLYPCPVSGLIVHGQQDSIVKFEDVLDFIDSIHKQKGVSIDCELIKKADHFFRDKHEELKQTIADYIDKKIEAQPTIKSERKKGAAKSLIAELM